MRDHARTSSRTTHRAPPTSSTSSRSAGQSSRASPAAPISTSPATRKFSGENLAYFDPQTKERYFPFVIEPAAGIDRAALAFLVDSYDDEMVEGRQRTVLRLHPRLAPVKAAVLPLVSKEGMPEKAREVFKRATRSHAGRVRRGWLNRQALPPPGRDRHSLGNYRRPPDDGGRHSHPPRPRLPRANPASRSRAWPTTSPPALLSPGAAQSWTISERPTPRLK